VNPNPKRNRLIQVALALAFVLLVSACGGDSDSGSSDSGGDSGSSSESPSSGDSDSGDANSGGSDSSGPSSDEVKAIQTGLNTVGCYTGEVDGDLGPNTEAGIRAFQAAKGLTVDGVVGPQTTTALTEAAAAGETVCSESTDPPPTGTDTVTLAGSEYEQTFTIGSCNNRGEADLVLQAEVNGNTLLINASNGTGTLSVDGGTTGEGIELNGTIDSVEKGDSDEFQVTGIFTEPNFVDGGFVASGTCSD
jgi:Putative peptidoglycan binding domain